VSTEQLTDAIIAHADAIEARLGPPGPDPSIEHVPVGTDPLVHQIVYSMLLWDACHELAGRALAQLRQSVVDFNELRVCSGAELRDLLPRDCPHKDERTSRLLATLNDVFVREHGLNMAGVSAMPKREARQYLDTLAGLPQFAAARVMLVALGGHAFPVDGRIGRQLRAAGLIGSDGATPDEIGSRLERAVRAADAPRVYALLEADAAANPAEATARKRTTTRSPARSRKNASANGEAAGSEAATPKNDGTDA
tara:strand:- start:25337 stop:26095 length:759 start_codon:yes stop_codon:yes gene_type:complete